MPRKCVICKKKQSNFNYENEVKALYCGDCKSDDMIDIKSPKCITCKKKQSIFNYENEVKALYCGDCKSDDMIDIKHPKCITCKKKQPTFNYENETKALYCVDCKEDDMIDIKHPKCITCKKKQSIFNYENEVKALYCGDCKSDDMIDIINPRCVICGKKRPTFNYENEIKALYCGDCKTDDMIDIISPKCITCKKRASYGIPNNKPSRCSQHKEKNMISNPRAKCKRKYCKNTASHGIKTPTHCDLHKKDNEINLIERRCKQCNRIDVLINDICINFCIMDEKFKIYKKQQKTKELHILNFLQTNFEPPTEYNIKIDNICGGKNSEQKEIGYDFKTHMVFVEVDENQHRYYDPRCELNRMINIYNASGGIPIVFIRYNPDKINGKRVSQKEREKILLNTLKYYKESIIEDHLTVKYLFYDNDNKNIILDPYHKNIEYNN